jgi:hypothetical protein
LLTVIFFRGGICVVNYTVNKEGPKASFSLPRS